MTAVTPSDLFATDAWKWWHTCGEKIWLERTLLAIPGCDTVSVVRFTNERGAVVAFVYGKFESGQWAISASGFEVRGEYPPAAWSHNSTAGTLLEALYKALG